MSSIDDTYGADMDDNSYDGCEVDELALAQLARLQDLAWQHGHTRRRLARYSATDDGVAAWDAPARRRRPHDDDPDMDRGPGLAPGRDRPGPTRFDPRTGKKELQRALTQRGWAGKLAMAHVAVAWEKIVGEHIAEHAQISSFEEGRLDIRCDSSSWAQQLRLMLPSLASAVRREVEQFSGAQAGAVDIRIFGPSAPTWKHGRYGGARGGRGPRDTYG